MAAPNCAIDICNLALDYLGQAPSIASIDPPASDIESLMARHYDACRQEVLRMHPWHFATKQIMCTRIGTPLSDYRDQYQLPADFIRLLSVGGTQEEWQRHDFRLNGKTILINNELPIGLNPSILNPAPSAATILIRYIYDCTDINQWDACAKKMLAHVIAIDVGYQITKQEDVVARLTKLLAQLIPDAYAVDGQENTPKRIEVSNIITKRQFNLGASIVASPYTWIP